MWQIPPLSQKEDKLKSCPIWQDAKKGIHITSVIFLPKVHNLILIHEEILDKPKFWEIVCKIMFSNFQSYPSLKSRKIWGTVPDWKKLEAWQQYTVCNAIYNSDLDPFVVKDILEQLAKLESGDHDSKFPDFCVWQCPCFVGNLDGASNQQLNLKWFGEKSFVYCIFPFLWACVCFKKSFGKHFWYLRR